MSRNAGIKINIWINEERMRALEQAGMAELTEEAFAGMRLLPIFVTEKQKGLILQRYPGAKYDSSTTGSIELLPKDAKDQLLALSIELNSTGSEVADRFVGGMTT